MTAAIMASSVAILALVFGPLPGVAPEVRALRVIVSASFSLLSLASFVMARRGQVRLAAGLLSAAVFASLMVLPISLQLGVYSPGLPLLASLIMFAGFLIRPTAALAIAVLSIGTVLGLLGAQAAGALSGPTPAPTPIVMAGGNIILFAIIGWLTMRYAKSFGNTIATLEETKQRLEAIIQTSPLAICTHDMNNIVVTWNPAAERMFGWTEAGAIGHPMLTMSPETSKGTENLSAMARNGALINQVELLSQRRDGSFINISLSIAPLKDLAEKQYGYLSIMADITERKAAEKQIEFLAYHDSLTGLPNRLLLQDRFVQAKAYAVRANTKVALLLMDLDNFKSINDTLGHDAGDALLKQVVTRLGECVRQTDIVSRQGGDEFLIILPGLDHADDTVPALIKIVDRLQDPFHTVDHEISTSVSIGVSIFPEDGTSFETLLKKADMAMYQVKNSGRNGYRFFDETTNVEAGERLMIRNDLRRALERNEFVLYYQPQHDLTSGAVVGAEALIRWNHPKQGTMAPGRFIPVAEESGLIVPIGEWVLREACNQAMTWKRAGLPDLSIAVNLSAVQFKRGNVEACVLQVLDETGFDPVLLELELTESILIQDVESVLASVKRLKLLGVKLSIDDFGTGYSSLSYLKRFDVDKLKIDQSFVQNLATDLNDAAIVRAIIQMAHALNLKTIAEGVETAEMVQQLRIFKCDEVQGYYYARPMQADEFERYAKSLILKSQCRQVL